MLERTPPGHFLAPRITHPEVPGCSVTAPAFVTVTSYPAGIPSLGTEVEPSPEAAGKRAPCPPGLLWKEAPSGKVAARLPQHLVSLG